MSSATRVNWSLLLLGLSICTVQGTMFCPKLSPTQGVEVHCLLSSSGQYSNCPEMVPDRTLARMRCQMLYKSNGPLELVLRCGRGGRWRGPGTTLRCHLDADGFVEGLIRRERVLIFGRSTCSYCQETKRIFDHLGEKYTAVEVDQLEPYKVELLRGALWKKTGMRTWPNVFVNGRHVGGNDATKVAFGNGNIRRWLQGRSQKGNQTYVFSRSYF